MATMRALEKQGLYDPYFEHDACGVGFVANIKGEKSHEIIRKGLEVLQNLTHRGACGCDPQTGDGAGLLMQIPHEFFAQETRALRFALPDPGHYAVAMVFLPRDVHERNECQAMFERIVHDEGQRLLGWRKVPTDPKACGEVARSRMPEIRQLFIGRGRNVADQDAFEQKLYLIRKQIEQQVRESHLRDSESFHIPSFSSRTIVYKGMLLPEQIPAFYPDLTDASLKSAMALVHQRFSTNTFPSWDRAHPYRFLAHNGEINTLRGNENWMHAREKMFSSPSFGEDIDKIRPIVDESTSDSGKLDNTVELLVRTGRSLPHAMMMMVPEAWQKHEDMSEAKRAFYQYHSCLMEPWDGPASIAFTDGVRIGAVLDRNGLRPSRFYVTR
ncbi:MAG TPA: glutamate synthase subunit alpha, partial [Terriglobales bacterium]|nr:glutamate synthase subunit alpha [Terriglobales bacterium]